MPLTGLRHLKVASRLYNSFTELYSPLTDPNLLGSLYCVQQVPVSPTGTLLSGF